MTAVAVQKDIKGQLKTAFLNYALAVIQDRAIPDVRDGLKPVQRRIIYIMSELGLVSFKPHKKSARVVGETLGKLHPHSDCLHADTKIFLVDGVVKTLKQLYDEQRDAYIICVDEKGKPKVEKAHDFRIGQYTNKIYKITLSTGEVIQATANHPFLMHNMEWIKAENLTEKMFLYCGVISEISDDQHRPYISFNKWHNRGNVHIQQLTAAYKYNRSAKKGISRHHVDFRPINNHPDNIEEITRGQHAFLHKDYLTGYEIGRHNMFHEDGCYREKIKKKNSYLMRSYNLNQGLYKAIRVIRTMQNDNVEISIQNYNEYRQKFYNYPSISTLIERKRVDSFEDLVEKANKLERMNDFDYEKVYGCQKPVVEQKIRKKFCGTGRKHVKNASFKVLKKMVEIGVEITIQNYAKYRRNCLSYKIYEVTDFNSLVEEFLDSFIYIEKIEIIEVDNEPMYDFTVDNYENLAIIACNKNDKYRIIIAHNSSLYMALVNLAQDFKTRYPLIDGHGNFGSLDQDPAAAMRYTEARLSKYAETMLRDLDPDVVKFIDNFDNSLTEPTVLPVMLPNILLNGTEGIAVGFATTMLPHNISEICDTIIHLIKNPDANLTGILNIIQGPDFPTGGISFIPDKNLLYSTGQGSMRVRAQLHIEDASIIITEIPYQTDKVSILTQIATLAKSKTIDGIINLRDESDRDGIRIVIETDGKNDIKSIINTLYLKSKLETSVSMKNLVLVDSVPTQLGLLDIFNIFLKFRRQVIRAKLTKENDHLASRLHVLDAIMTALKDIDKIIEIIRQSKNSKEAQILLKKSFEFTPEQTTAILEMRLSRLLRLESQKCQDELTQLQKRKTEVVELLGNTQSFDKMLIKEIETLKTEVGDKRRTLIVDNFANIAYEGKKIKISVMRDKIIKGHVDNAIYIKDHFISEILFLVASDGSGHYIKCADLSDENKLDYEVIHVCSKPESLFCITDSGNLALVKVRDKDFKLMGLEDEKLVKVFDDVEGKEIILFTKQGMALRIKTEQVRLSGSGVKGVRGINLNKGDVVQDVLLMSNEGNIIYSTQNGYIKALPIKYIPLQGRGGKGVIACRLNENTGTFAKCFSESIHIKTKNKITKLDIKSIPICDRYQIGEKYDFDEIFEKR